jgi:cobalamin biosynthetic protein CobC
MLEHGGNLAMAAARFGIPINNWIDLSTGINPAQYPVPLVPASAWQRLPEDEDGLVQAACNYYGCRSALPTAGSQAALQTIPKLRAPGKIAMPTTMYQEHAHAWRTQGHTMHFFHESPDTQALTDADVILICNPNNPTGKRFSKNELLTWHAQLAARGAWLVVDEAFMDCSPDDSLAAHTHLEGLFVLRSLGKFFGLAGARVGFLLAAEHYLNRVKEMIGPWSVTGPSRYIATQALQDKQWQLDTRKTLALQSNKMRVLLEKYHSKVEGHSDLFHYVPTAHAAQIQEQLAQLGIWVRLFSQPSALRFGLPPAHQWPRLQEALQKIHRA